MEDFLKLNCTSNNVQHWNDLFMVFCSIQDFIYTAFTIMEICLIYIIYLTTITCCILLFNRISTWQNIRDSLCKIRCYIIAPHIGKSLGLSFEYFRGWRWYYGVETCHLICRIYIVWLYIICFMNKISGYIRKRINSGNASCYSFRNLLSLLS